ncbi:MAG: sulfite exporter TauE/SafE family protein [Candidatus Eisenbacteria bacterium]
MAPSLSPMLLQGAGLLALGLALGSFGTLIGAGGGFLLAPILVLLDPHADPALLTATSLAVVCLNASSGSLAYRRMGRIDVRSAIVFALASVPGAALGVWAVHRLDRGTYETLLGVSLLAIAAFLLWRRVRPPHEPLHAWGRPTTRRVVIERDGTRHEFAYDLRIALAISAGVGFLSSLLGIGGGILHVPAMANLLGFPVHIATATSHAVLAAMTLVAVVLHAFDGSLAPALPRILPIGLGAVIGAQLGARASGRMSGPAIMTSLALALALVGLRILMWR